MIKEANVTIMAKDMDRSIAFYQAIGLELKNRWGDHYAQLGAPGLIIGLHPAGAENPATGSGSLSIGFTTDDFEKASALLKQAGVEAANREEKGGQFLHFKDPDGTELYFIKPKW